MRLGGLVGLAAKVAGLPGIGPLLALPSARLALASGEAAIARQLLTGATNQGRDSAEHHYRLAWAQERLGELDAATDSYRDSLALDDTHAGAHYRLARLLRSNDPWAALEHLKGAARLAPQDVHIHHALGNLLGRLGDHHGAAEAFQEAIARAPDNAPRHASLARMLTRAASPSAVHHLKTAAELEPKEPTRWTALGDLLGQLGNHTGAALAYGTASRILPDDPSIMAREADALGRADHWDRAALLREELVARDPGEPDLLMDLADAYANCPDTAFANDGMLGLSIQRVGRVDEAIAAARKARELDPSRSDIGERLGFLLAQGGHYSEATAELQAAVNLQPNASSAFRLGQAYQRPEVADFSSAAEAYRQSFALDRTRVRTAISLLRMTIRLQEWEEGWAIAQLLQERVKYSAEAERAVLAQADLFTGRAPQVDPLDLVAALARAVGSGATVHREVLRFISARLQSMGFLALGFEVKALLAEQILGSPPQRASQLKPLCLRAQALAYLGRTKEVLALLDPTPWSPSSTREATVLAKLAADAHLLNGDPSRLFAFAREIRTSNPLPGEDLMDDMVRGKRVALVGPSEVSLRNGPDIDQFDTVVRPRFMRSFVETNGEFGGYRTDVSYYSGRDLGPLQDEMEEAIQSGVLKLAVARPLAYKPNLTTELRLDAGLRFYRHEYALYLESSPLGIQRIIYDLLQYRPAELRLFNLDFYAGAKAFAEGYREPKDYTVSTDSLLNDLFASHDLRTDFEFTRSLRDAGVIQASPDVAAILDLPTQAYLERVESAGTLI